MRFGQILGDKFRMSADDNGNGGGTQPPPTPQTPPPATAAPPPAGDAEDWKMEDLPPPLQKYIKGLRSEAADRRTELDRQTRAATEAAQAAENARLAEQQKWQELAQKHETDLKEAKPKLERAERIEQAFVGLLEKQMENLPDYLKSLAKKIGDPVELAAWLAENADQITPRRAPGQDGGNVGDNKTLVKLTPEQQAAARKAGITDEEYAKYL